MSDSRKRILAATSSAAAAGAVVAGGALAQRLRGRAAQRSRRYRLEPGESPCTALPRIASGQLDLALEELASADRHRAIHETRKALKRSRALLRLYRDLLGDDIYRTANRQLRDAGRLLSSQRDQEVLLQTLAKLRTQAKSSKEDTALLHIEARLEAGAETHRPANLNGDVGPRAAVAEAAALISEVRLQVAGWPLPEDGGEQALREGFARIYRRGRRAQAVLTPSAEDQQWHELRKRAKDLWHCAQLLERSAPSRMQKLAGRAHALSDLVGDDHDLAVLEEHIREHCGGLEKDVELVGKAIRRRRRELKREARPLAKRVYRRKPRRATRHLGLS